MRATPVDTINAIGDRRCLPACLDDDGTLGFRHNRRLNQQTRSGGISRRVKE